MKSGTAVSAYPRRHGSRPFPIAGHPLRAALAIGEFPVRVDGPAHALSANRRSFRPNPSRARRITVPDGFSG